MSRKVTIKVRDVEGGLEGAPLWVTTFVDMTSLLVTFFILLFTFSSIREFDSFSYPQSLPSLSGIWNPESQKDLVAPKDDIMQAYDMERGARVPHARPADKLFENLEDMGQKLTEDHIEVDLQAAASGLRVQFPERAGFAPGSAFVNAPLRTALREMGQTMQHYSHMVLVEGFTDDNFSPTPGYPTAQDLSLARAAAAASALLEESGLSELQVQVAGRGAAAAEGPSYKTAVERRRDRRVEVVILAMEFNRARLYAERSGKQEEGGAR